MTSEWLAAVEEMVVPLTLKGTRTIGFTTPRPVCDVKTVSRATAEVLSRAGLTVLYADLTSDLDTGAGRPLRVAAAGSHWHEPVEGQSSGLYFTSPQGMPAARTVFNNIPWLRNEFAKTFRTFSKIIVEMPPLLGESADLVNSLAAAAACDGVVMVCARGKIDYQDIEQAMQLFSSAQVNLLGTVLDDSDYVTPAEEMAKTARRFSKMTGGLGNYIARKIESSEMLR